MRILNGLLALILLGFAALQYNDPDAALWALIYGVAGGWALLAALAPAVLARAPALVLLSLTAAAALLGVVGFWPDAPGWWRIEVWWETETAREGMGMMIVALALLAPVATAIRVLRARRNTHAAAFRSPRSAGRTGGP